MFSKSNDKELLEALAGLRPADYTKKPELGAIYARLVNGRKEFAKVYEKDKEAVEQLGSLDQDLAQHIKTLEALSSHVAAASEKIYDATSETTSVAERVSQQHEELTNTIISASEETSDVYKKIDEGQNELNNIRELSNQTIEMSKAMQKDMDQLSDVILHMNEVIEGINSISSQTNLLALNASIEAARAGEAGKGFAVVADEIRKLAEETQKLTGDMGQFVEGIRGASEKSVTSAKDTITALGSMTEKIENVWKLNEQNQQNVSQINDSISSLAAVSEEISSSMTEMENEAGNIKEQCETLKDDSAKMSDVTDALADVARPVPVIKNTLEDAAQIMDGMSKDVFYAQTTEK